MKERDERVAKISERMGREDFVFSRLADGTGVVMDLDQRQVHTLNGSAVVLLESIRNGAKSALDLQTALVERFGIAPETAANGVEAFLGIFGRASSEEGPVNRLR